MRSKRLAAAVCCVLLLFLLIPTVGAAKAEDDIVNGILAQQTGEDTVQEWIDDTLAASPGTAEWYVLTLSQYGTYDFSNYAKALTAYLSENEVRSASSRQKYALTLMACGTDDAYIAAVTDESIGQQGVMSWVFGLHLLNNGAVSTTHTMETVTAQLLSLCREDGGWSVTGQYGGVDVTAMALQALVPQYGKNEAVTAAVDKALLFLAERQNADGDYSSYGVANAESTAQVIATLSALGIDAKTDERFIKNGKTPFDGLERYRLADGSFCHQVGGDSNDTATVQALYATVAYQRFQAGKSPMLMLDKSLAEAPRPIPYKPWVTVAIVGIAAVVCIVLVCLKKHTVKNLAVVLIVAAVLVAAVWFVNIQTTESYYGQDTTKTDTIGTVTLSICCDAIADRSAPHIPDDGYLLKEESFAISEGDTVYDILREAAVAHRLVLDTDGGAESIYVQGIGNIYEFDHGELSGWLYFVNGEKAVTNCAKYTLSDGDTVEWRYTCNLGEDLT